MSLEATVDRRADSGKQHSESRGLEEALEVGSEDPKRPSQKAKARHRTALILGNPNVGKTSLFNHLTGLRARVGNYPGVTVDRKSGPVLISDAPEQSFELIDAPGAYSLAARSAEEQIALWEALGQAGDVPPRVLIAVVDAGQLARSLYLVLQLIELRIPTVIALNMVDEAGEGCPSPEALEAELGVPVVGTNGRTGAGTQELARRAAQLMDDSHQFLPRLAAHYPPELRAAADRVAEALPPSWKGSVERNRALGFWALSSLDDDDELVDVPEKLREVVREVDRGDLDVDLQLATSRYDAIEKALSNAGLSESEDRAKTTERVDRILLHPVLGFVAFSVTMFVVFQALFAWADPAISALEWAVSSLQELTVNALPASVVRDLLVEGIIGGVGNVVVFLPQILLLFLFIGLLEDSGYMARVAYLMDRVMRSLGLHGRAFVPMLSGFACAIPAIMATRTLERRRDRLLTIMVVPLMTCSARLPVYSLIIAALFPVGTFSGLPVQGLLLLCMYLLSVVMAMIAAWVLGRTAIKGRAVPLILELPPYRLPRLKPTLLMMRRRAGDFLREAGGIILVATVLLWGLLNFPQQEAESASRTDSAAETADTRPGSANQSRTTSATQQPHVANTASQSSDEAARAARELRNSYGGRLGRAIEPLVEPLGFDWKIATGIIGAFAAREVFVSTMALVYGVGEVDDQATPLRQRMRAEQKPDGSPRYTPLVGLSLMVFFALACQCMSTLAVVRRETQSIRYPLLLFGYMTTLAYICSLLVYQVGRLVLMS